MNNFREYKIRHDHEKARGILKNLNATFVKKELLEDFYLVSNDRDIYKIAKASGGTRFIHLVNEGNNFRKSTDIELEASAEKVLVKIFDNSGAVMRKNREHYKWKQSKIVLDSITDLDEFIEFYPANEEDKEALFTKFRVEESDLIVESYYSLSLK